MELWSKINEAYSVSNMGRFWSANIGVMKTPIMNTGYPHVNIRENGKTYRHMVHVTVAIHFIPNPLNKPCVNHINGNRADCRFENLEWVTYSENQLHAFKFLGKKGSANINRRKTVIAIRDGLSIVVEANGIREMARRLSIPYQGIQDCIKYPRRKYFGWSFQVLFDPKWAPKKIYPFIPDSERRNIPEVLLKAVEQ